MKEKEKRVQAFLQGEDAEAAEYLTAICKQKGMTLAACIRGLIRREAAMQRYIREGLPPRVA